MGDKTANLFSKKKDEAEKLAKEKADNAQKMAEEQAKKVGEAVQQTKSEAENLATSTGKWKKIAGQQNLRVEFHSATHTWNLLK